jgi:3-oxoacyl-[acyl-carrier protein] reductase
VRDGVIVALTDLLGVQPWGVFSAHGAAKAAQIHLVKALALAWSADGIRVCGVSPGPLDLPDDKRREATLRAAHGDPDKLVGSDDIAAAVRFCIETPSLTGVNIPVDHGALLSH